jgi:pseudouridine-5'-phosphate glycosidase
VVCAGAKAILDLPATLEYLETHAVPVVGYQTNEFPAFYSAHSRLATSHRADSPEDVVELARTHWGLGLESALLVTAPPPPEVAMPEDEVRQAVKEALKDAKKERVRGQRVTPFLLQRVTELTGNASLRANLGLLRNNACIAGQVARAWQQTPNTVSI